VSYPLILVVLGVILIVGGLKGYSISHLLTGQLVPRTPPTPPGGNVSLPASGGTAGYVSPVQKSAAFARIDQGVDYSQQGQYVALGSGVIQRIASGWSGGTGKAVYVKLDNPITISGITYDGYYVAETNPLVHEGQKVNVGQPIATGGSAELGFLVNGAPTPLQGGLGASTQPTQAGKDFYSFVKGLLGG
jgi:hypothetical protein